MYQIVSERQEKPMKKDRRKEGREGGTKKNEKQELRRNFITTIIGQGISL